MNRRILSILILATCALPDPATATIYYNDNWEKGDSTAFQLGNCGGECDAVVLEPESYPFDVNYVYAMASGAAGGSAVLLADVWVTSVDDSGRPDLNNILGGMEAASVTLEAATWFEVDLTLDSPVTVESGEFAVAFCFYEDEKGFEPCNYVGLGADTGPMVSGGGFVYAKDGMACVGFQTCEEYWPSTASWYTNDQLGLDRNWIIRASDTSWSPETGGDDDDDDASSDDDDVSSDDDDAAGEEVIVESIEPSSIIVGDTSVFTVTGQGFGSDADAVDLFLGSLRVDGIDIDGEIQIEGVFPAELGVGVHDVCVETDSGREDCKLAALEVKEVEPETADGCDCTLASTRVGAGLVALLLFGGVLGYRRLR